MLLLQFKKKITARQFYFNFRFFENGAKTKQFKVDQLRSTQHCFVEVALRMSYSGQKELFNKSERKAHITIYSKTYHNQYLR